MPLKEFVSGEVFPFLGKDYRLKVIPSSRVGKDRCRLGHGRFLVEVESGPGAKAFKDGIRQALIDWYIHRASETIPERVAFYSQRMGQAPRGIQIKNHRSLWGSCSSKGVIRFNWKLIMAPLPLMDYVVVHELCHLVHPRHSRLFWTKVEAIIPDHKKRRCSLRQYGSMMAVFD